MKNLPTQTRAVLKRTALINAARMDFIEGGYEETTSKTIARRAYVSTGSFYQYFDNKDDILRTIAQQRIDNLNNNLTSPRAHLTTNNSDLELNAAQSNESAQEFKSIQAIFKRVLALIYDFHEQDPEIHQVLDQRRNIDPELAKILDEGDELLEQKVRLFVQSFNVDTPDTVAFNLFAMAEGLVHRHVFQPSNSSKAKILTLGAAMLASYFEQYDRRK